MTITITTTSDAYKAARKILNGHRKIFESVGDAIKALRNIYAIDGFPAGFDCVAAAVGSIDVSGDDTVPPLADWPEAYRADGVKVCVTFVGVRGIKGEDGKETNGARGFAVMPLHPLDALQADEAGLAWLWKVAEKEASHVALRGLRNVSVALGSDAFAQAAMSMPVTVSDYVEESDSEAMDTTAFDTLWKDFRKMLAESPATAAIAHRMGGKAEVLKSIRSKAYALENNEELEKMNAFTWIANTMVGLIEQLKQNAIEAGEDFDLDSDEIKGWLATRDTKVFAAPKKLEGDLSTVDFAAFASGLGVKGE